MKRTRQPCAASAFAAKSSSKPVAFLEDDHVAEAASADAEVAVELFDVGTDLLSAPCGIASEDAGSRDCPVVGQVAELRSSVEGSRRSSPSATPFNFARLLQPGRAYLASGR